MTGTLTIEQAAEQLNCSVGFVDKMIAKGRLSLLASGELASSDVLALGKLMGKLRSDGMAAMVSIAGERPDTLSE